MKTRTFLSAGAAALACAHAYAAKPAAPTDPWAKVPALPTACYTQQDQAWAQHSAALAAIKEDHDNQTGINSAIQQAANKAQQENPMAMANAMQQAMMNDPQNAQKYIEQMMAPGQAAVTEVPEQNAKEEQLAAEAKAIIRQYKAALESAEGPGRARWEVLRKKRGYGPDARGPGESGEPAWVYTEWNGILHDYDAAYVANCANWWAAGKPIHAYLERYKDYLVQERTPTLKKLEEPALEQYKLLNVSTAGYRSTQDFSAAELYMTRADEMFGERRREPRCQAADRCDVF